MAYYDPDLGLRVVQAAELRESARGSLSGFWDDLTSGLKKTAEWTGKGIAAEYSGIQPTITPGVTQQVPKSFLEKHGLTLAIGAAGLGAMYFFLLRKKR